MSSPIRRRPQTAADQQYLPVVRELVRRFEEIGGIADVLLTHRDDVADAERFVTHFGARSWIHEHDREAAPFATGILKGRDPTSIRDDVLAIPVPGHARQRRIFNR